MDFTLSPFSSISVSLSFVLLPLHSFSPFYSLSLRAFPQESESLSSILAPLLAIHLVLESLCCRFLICKAWKIRAPISFDCGENYRRGCVKHFPWCLSNLSLNKCWFPFLPCTISPSLFISFLSISHDFPLASHFCFPCFLINHWLICAYCSSRFRTTVILKLVMVSNTREHLPMSGGKALSQLNKGANRRRDAV